MKYFMKKSYDDSNFMDDLMLKRFLLNSSDTI